ncbi:MAG: S9 family peptidase [Gemmatimonadetes bacterium]|nr:S9 family peptidase [Gemmatimonadota bacterium]
MPALSLRLRTLAALALAATSLAALPCTARAQLTVDRWLVLGPVHAAAPFGARTDSAWLDASRPPAHAAWPAGGSTWSWPGAGAQRWSPGTGAAADGDALYAVAYVDADAWQRVGLKFTGGDDATRRVWIDGRRVSSASVDLARGTHMVLVQRIGRPAGAGTPLSLTLTPATAGGHLTARLDPRHAPSFRELHDVIAVSDVRLDDAASKVAIVTRWQDAAADRSAGALEIRDVASGHLLGDVRQGNPRDPEWSRQGDRLAYLVAGDRTDSAGTDLMVWDAASGATTRVLRGEPARSIVGWSPDGAWIYYTGTARALAPDVFKPGEARRLTEVWQRQGDPPLKENVFAVNVAQGTRFTVVGDSSFGVAGAALSPDGKTIAFSRNAYTNVARPWLDAEIWTVDVASLATTKVIDLPKEAFNAPGAFAWSPDSRALAFCASTKEAQQTESPTFSVYENGLFATRLDHPALVDLSAGFIPNVGGGLGCTRVRWDAKDGRIYVPVDAGARTMPARTRRAVTSALERTTLELVSLPGEVMTGADVAAGTMVAATETPVTPATVYRVDLATGAAASLAQPNAHALDALAMPAWRPWSFKNSRGEDIEAWYWLPPGFDSTASYPMIVHYYGGTLPMKKNFEQRLLWFAASGYVVLFMNPAGTPGYGQKFADYHINDWGFPAATDIIEGTERFTATHRYVDAARVGNFGHSYGGFMTMHLHTRTKIFRTGIAIAGISNIADYWGAGGSGYSYTDGTCPGCYPWNRKDVYVDRSPLFQADKITAPMLLIHGTDDTNVVPTESEQLFTALRMLGREAELVRVKGENHGINSKPSVEQLRDGLLLDWFEKYLKGRPEAWTARWNAKR